MNLSTLVATLAALDPAMPVKLNGVTGLGVDSWRGIYNEVTIHPGSTTLADRIVTETYPGGSYDIAETYLEFEPATTVGELHAALFAASDGQRRLMGYKGGCYSADPSSTVHADSYGNMEGLVISGVMVAGGEAALATDEKDPWA